MPYLGHRGGPDPLTTQAMHASVFQLKAQAVETGTTVFHDGLQITPEGKYCICGRFCTLNEAIMYLGNRAVTRAKAQA